ncbi:uncharacterized protein LOC118464256 [Anopheles albimanus]|uniref:Uncharacterized protein n=1 Tax=Anopheles albimanus TaxID=7167 RepID=A0A182FC78_ANOAL|nr:uncharacterized protein LOC118464256 [Anopheles albimanus]
MNRDEELAAWKELYRELLQLYRDYKSRCTCHMSKLADEPSALLVGGIEENEEIEVIEETEGIDDNEEIEVIEETEGIEETHEIDEAHEIDETEEIEVIDEIEEAVDVNEEMLDTSESALHTTMYREELPPDPGRSEANCLISYAPPKLPVGSIYDLHCINNFLKTEHGRAVIRKAYFKNVPAKHVIVDIFFDRHFLTKVEFSKAHYSRQVVLKKFPNFLKFFLEVNKEFYDFSADKTEKRLKGTIHRARKGLRK